MYRIVKDSILHSTYIKCDVEKDCMYFLSLDMKKIKDFRKIFFPVLPLLKVSEKTFMVF
jgi:hypothetical protein